MKKFILTIAAMTMFALSSASMANNTSFQCWAYLDGNPTQRIDVSANDVAEAEALALKEFDKLAVKTDSVHCE